MQSNLSLRGTGIFLFKCFRIVKQPDQSQIRENVAEHLLGYYKISRHYKWALDQVFMQQSFDSVIVTEGEIK